MSIKAFDIEVHLFCSQMHHQPPRQAQSSNWEKIGLLVALWTLETPQLLSRGTKGMIPAAEKCLTAQLLRFRILLLVTKDGISVLRKMNWEMQPSGFY